MKRSLCLRLIEPVLSNFQHGFNAFRSLFVDALAQEASHLACRRRLQAALVLCVVQHGCRGGQKYLAFIALYRRIAQDLTLRLQWKRLQVAHAVRARLRLCSGGTRMHA